MSVARFEELTQRRADLLAKMQGILDGQDRNGNISKRAAVSFDAAEAEVDRIDVELRRLKASGFGGGGLTQGTVTGATARGVLRSESTYRPDRETSFFKDMLNARQDPDAQERLHRNQREALETRDITTGDPGAGGFVPPIYLGEAYASLARPDRPFADVVPKLPFPEHGITVQVPKVQSGVTVASQATQNTAVSETDLDSQTVTASMVTIAGLNDVSLQALERSFPGLDQIVFNDLMAAYDQELDRQLIEGSGASGEHAGIRGVSGAIAVSYTDASPTAAELIPKVYDAIQQVASTRYRNADIVVMHPRRAAWLGKELSASAPLFQQGALRAALGEQDDGFLTSFAGLEVVLDPNVPTDLGAGTEDEIYVLHKGDLLLMESGFRAVRFDDIGSATLTVRLRLHGYSFFVPNRQAKSVAIISGTGLAAPSF